MVCLHIYRELLLLATFLWVYSNSKEFSYFSWQNTYPNLKATCHVKLKLFLWTKLFQNLLLAKYLIYVAAPLRFWGFWDSYSYKKFSFKKTCIGFQLKEQSDYLAGLGWTLYDILDLDFKNSRTSLDSDWFYNILDLALKNYRTSLLILNWFYILDLELKNTRTCIDFIKHWAWINNQAGMPLQMYEDFPKV